MCGRVCVGGLFQSVSAANEQCVTTFTHEWRNRVVSTSRLPLPQTQLLRVRAADKNKSRIELKARHKAGGSKAALQSAPGQKSHILEINFHATAAAIRRGRLAVVHLSSFFVRRLTDRFRNLLQSRHLQISRMAYT